MYLQVPWRPWPSLLVDKIQSIRVSCCPSGTGTQALCVPFLPGSSAEEGLPPPLQPPQDCQGWSFPISCHHSGFRSWSMDSVFASQPLLGLSHPPSSDGLSPRIHIWFILVLKKAFLARGSHFQEGSPSSVGVRLTRGPVAGHLLPSSGLPRSRTHFS